MRGAVRHYVVSENIAYRPVGNRIFVEPIPGPHTSSTTPMATLISSTRTVPRTAKPRTAKPRVGGASAGFLRSLTPKPAPSPAASVAPRREDYTAELQSRVKVSCQMGVDLSGAATSKRRTRPRLQAMEQISAVAQPCTSR